jgi:hypothetical protein
MSQNFANVRFHWYAVSACNFVKTVGPIAYRQIIPVGPSSVCREGDPEVLAFRDKVAAHFAWATRNSKDNEAERLASILPPLSFVRGIVPGRRLVLPSAKG